MNENEIFKTIVYLVFAIIGFLAYRSMKKLGDINGKNMREITKGYGFTFCNIWKDRWAFNSKILIYKNRITNVINGSYEGENILIYNYTPWKEEIFYSDAPMLSVGEVKINSELPFVLVVPKGRHNLSDEVMFRHIQFSSGKFMDKYEVLVEKDMDSTKGAMIFQMFDLRFLDTFQESDKLFFEVNNGSIKIIKEGIIKTKGEVDAILSSLVILAKNAKQSWNDSDGVLGEHDRIAFV